jgi:hypothetical protein
MSMCLDYFTMGTYHTPDQSTITTTFLRYVVSQSVISQSSQSSVSHSQKSVSESQSFLFYFYYHEVTRTRKLVAVLVLRFCSLWYP